MVKRGYGELPLKDWEVPVMISYNSRYKQLEYKGLIMEPLLLKSPSEPEKKFMEKLANSHKVRWWFKNGENDIEYFAILYKDENDFERAFYVDFIVMFNNGIIGLFDTKSGATTEGAKLRAEGLQIYIKRENKNRNKLYGGIVILKDGSFWYNHEEEYQYNPHNLSENWEILEL